MYADLDRVFTKKEYMVFRQAYRTQYMNDEKVMQYLKKHTFDQATDEEKSYIQELEKRIKNKSEQEHFKYK